MVRASILGEKARTSVGEDQFNIVLAEKDKNEAVCDNLDLENWVISDMEDEESVKDYAVENEQALEDCEQLVDQYVNNVVPSSSYDSFLGVFWYQIR